MAKFYITTTLPYVNADPHIGFGLEITKADVIARSQRLLGNTVIFNTGTDEHGQKIYQKAMEEGKDPQAYCDAYAGKFGELKELLNLSYTNFIRTTDAHHIHAAQEFWKRCDANGYIYKKLYKIKYCVGCELEKTDSELVNERCPLHPNKALEIREEENYFFKFSLFQTQLLEFYRANPHFVVPDGKFSEIISFVEMGLQDFSISRLKSKMPWGVDVPTDPDHVMYVWFDALVNYISTIGWPTDESQFHEYWPGVQIAGKDNLRQQSAMWQAMLFAAGLPPSQTILINGFISVDGAKMSKSLGNVISPNELVAKYGSEGTRYVLLKLGDFGTDSDVNWDKFDQTYTSDLSNGIGNLTARILKLASNERITPAGIPTRENDLLARVLQLVTEDKLVEAIECVMDRVRELDRYLSLERPWKDRPESENANWKSEILGEALLSLKEIAGALQPFLPKTAESILNVFSGDTIETIPSLFPKLEAVRKEV